VCEAQSSVVCQCAVQAPGTPDLTSPASRFNVLLLGARKESLLLSPIFPFPSPRSLERRRALLVAAAGDVQNKRARVAATSKKEIKTSRSEVGGQLNGHSHYSARGLFSWALLYQYRGARALVAGNRTVNCKATWP